jgi:hypothetical protein
LPQDECGDFRRSVGFVSQLDAQHFAGLNIFGKTEWEELQFFPDVFDAASHQALDRVHRPLGSFNEIFTRGAPDDDLVVLVERDHRWH